MSRKSSKMQSLNISPILPPSNVTINLPNTPTSKIPTLTSGNILTNPTLHGQEQDPVILITSTISADSYQESVQVVYDSGPIPAEMPTIPNPSWKTNPAPPRSDPPHVVIEIDNSSKVTRRLVLKTEYDPFQLAEAALHSNLIDLTSEANQDDVIVLSDDDDLTIHPILLPDPVPAVSGIPDLIPVPDDDDSLPGPSGTTPARTQKDSTSARTRNKSAPQANQPQKKRALYKLRDFHIQLVDFRRYLRNPDDQPIFSSTDLNVVNRNVQGNTITSNRSRSYPDILYGYRDQQEDQDISPDDESQNSSTLSNELHLAASDSFGTGSDRALPRSISGSALISDSQLPSQEDKEESNQSQFSSDLPAERSREGARGGHASAGEASYPQ